MTELSFSALPLLVVQTEYVDNLTVELLDSVDCHIELADYDKSVVNQGRK